MNRTHIAFCLDESGSVRSIVRALVDAYNKNVESIRESVLSRGLEATISAFAFGDQCLHHRTLYKGQQIQTVKTLFTRDLNPSGMTPLFDSLYRAIKELQMMDDNDPETAFIVTVVTDGQENDSRYPGINMAINEMNKMIATDRWTFTFLVPNRYIRDFLQRYNISSGNVQAWDETSDFGTEEAFKTNSMAYDSYFGLRSRGITASSTFYSDLSNVKVKDVKNLADISKSVKFYETNKTMQIRDMYEEVTGQTYIKGTAFYQLVKTEKIVQPYKLVVIRNRKNGKTYAGSQARNLLGIAINTNIRLAPGDHGDWDIFIQSTSVNRKILPGNKLMVWYDAVKYQN